MSWVDDVDLKVEIGFGSGPLAAAPSWTDINTGSIVRRVRTKRGRSSVRRAFDAGTMRVTIDNRDAEFDPNNSGSTYAGDMKIGTPIRTRATHDATTHDVWYGHITSWPLNYQMPSEATVELEATGNLKLLRSTGLDATYSAERADERIGNILDDANWPAGARALDVGVDVAGITYMGGAGSLIDKTVEAEQGLFFIANDGDAVFYNKLQCAGATAAADFGGANLGYSDIKVLYDNRLLINKATYTGAIGDPQTFTDATSVTAHGESTPTGTGAAVTNTSILDGEHALNTATWVVGKYKDPKQRVVGFKIDPPTDEANLFAEVLSRDLGDVVGIVFSPPGGGTDLNQLSRVEGITHDIGPGYWITNYKSHPLSAQETTAYWVLGTSDDLDTNTVLA